MRKVIQVSPNKVDIGEGRRLKRKINFIKNKQSIGFKANTFCFPSKVDPKKAKLANANKVNAKLQTRTQLNH